MWIRGLEWFNAPNPYSAHLRLADLQMPGSNIGRSFWGGPPGISLNEALVIVLRDYAIAHGLLAVTLGGLAVMRLRAVAAKQSAGIVHKKALVLRPAPHPPIRERPVLWKEMYCEAKPRQRWLAVFFSRWFFVASFLPAWAFFVFMIETRYDSLSAGALWLLRYVGTFVVGLLCLRVALHAARSVGGERDRQTLDSLLTTQLTPAEIVRDKWWGGLLTGRWVFGWLVLHWCLGVLVFAVNPLMVPVLAVETLVFAAFAVSLGMYCAARFSTTKQALAATLLIGLVGTTLVPWAGGKFFGVMAWDVQPMTPPGRLYNYGRPPPTPWPELVGLGLTPPRVLASTVVPWRSYYPSGWYYDHDYGGDGVVLPIACGLVVYGLAAWGLRAAAMRRFRRSLAGPVVRRRPAGRPAARVPRLPPAPLPQNDNRNPCP
jgi:hypothetical protein